MGFVQIRLTRDGGTDVVETGYRDLADAAKAEPVTGVYLVANTFGSGKVIRIDSHFDRVERSAAALGVDVAVPRERIREILRAMRKENDFSDCRFRISMDVTDPGIFLVSMEEFHGLPEEYRLHGVVCATRENSARPDPLVKSTSWLRRRSTENGIAAGTSAEAVFEYLLCDETGRILEGASSNFFGVIGSGDKAVLRNASEGVLAGITRNIVISVTGDLVPIVFEPVHQTCALSEAFITSSTRGVVPVRQIDDCEIPAPGPITAEISRRYQDWIYSHAEPL